MQLAEFRKQYPQYDDMPDTDLATSLHKKYYSDIPYEEFSKTVGLTAVEDVSRGTLDKPLEVPVATGDSLAESIVKGSGRAAVSLGVTMPGGIQRAVGETVSAQMGGPWEEIQLTPEEETALPKKGAEVLQYMLPMETEALEEARKAGDESRMRQVMDVAIGRIREDALNEKRTAARGEMEAKYPEIEAGISKQRIGTEMQQRMQPSPGTGAIAKFAGEVTEAGLGSLAPMIGLGIVTGGSTVPLMLMGTGVFGQTYGQARADGRSRNEATADALYSAAAETLTEKIPLDYILKNPAGKTWLKRWLTAAGLEGGQEALSSVLQSVYDVQVKGEEITLYEGIKRAAHEGLIGAALGVGGAVVTQPFQEKTPVENILDQAVDQADSIKKAAGISETLEQRPSLAEKVDFAPAEELEKDLKPIIDEAKKPPPGGAMAAAFEKAQLKTEIDEAAHEAATSPTNELPEPTEAQIEAGTYKKGHIKVQGLDITIENPEGSTRSGTDISGKEWTSTLKSHYGYIKRTEGADGEHVDVFVGKNPESEQVFVVDQIEPTTGKFDEHKILVGFDSQAEAEAGYLANYEEGWQGMKAIHPMSVEEFKTWLEDGSQKKPLGVQIEAEIKAAPTAKETAAREEIEEKQRLAAYKQQHRITKQTEIKKEDTLITVVAKLGGIQMDEAQAQGIDQKDFTGARHGIRRAFTRAGDSFDGMAEKLRQHGFVFTGPSDLLTALRDEIGGKPIRTPAGEMAHMEEVAKQREYEAEQRGNIYDEAEYVTPESDTDSRVIENLFLEATEYPDFAAEIDVIETESEGLEPSEQDAILKKRIIEFLEARRETGREKEDARAREEAVEGREEAEEETIGSLQKAWKDSKFGEGGELPDKIRALQKTGAKKELDAGRMPVFKGRNLFYAVHPATDGKHKYQVTTYNDTGALSDTRYDSLEKAIADADILFAELLSPKESEKVMAGLAKAEGEFQAKKKEFDLEQQAAEDIKKQEQARKEAQQAEQEAAQKAKADKEAFILTGSERTADQLAARGQMELPAEPITKLVEKPKVKRLAQEQVTEKYEPDSLERGAEESTTFDDFRSWVVGRFGRAKMREVSTQLPEIWDRVKGKKPAKEKRAKPINRITVNYQVNGETLSAKANSKAVNEHVTELKGRIDQLRSVLDCLRA